MLYARLGDTGLVVSRVAFGAMTFGSAEGRMAAVFKVDQAGADQLVGRSLEAGVNFFNTADMYANGQSEEMLGKALGKKRRDVAIATKVGFRMGEALLRQGLSRQHILASAEDSLRRLNTDYIDLYLAHTVDAHTPIEETLGAMEDLARAGKVRYVGFSNWPAWMAALSVGIQRERGWGRFCAAELYYSLVGRDVELDLVPFMKAAGMGMLVWSPLASGFLSGKYTRQNPGGGGGRLTQFDMLPMDKEKGYDLVEKLRVMGAARGASVAQMSIAWLLAKPWATSILIGASKMSQLEDNLKAVEVKITAEEVAELDKMTMQPTVYPHWFNQTISDGPVDKALGKG